MFTKMRKSKKGFTLIELIVVIAILGILALIAVPRLGGFRENARQRSDEQLAATLANAAAMAYAMGDDTPTTVKLYDADLIKYATDALVIDEVKSAKYAVGASPDVLYEIDADGAVTVSIGATLKGKK